MSKPLRERGAHTNLMKYFDEILGGSLYSDRLIALTHMTGTYFTTNLLPFLLAAGLLILYLIGSAMTEMGTKFPWKK